MSDYSCFDIIGPVMVGPSSSHTAGAVRLGRFARSLTDGMPTFVDIQLHGSFAETYKGHGTDLAIISGLSIAVYVGTLPLSSRKAIIHLRTPIIFAAIPTQPSL